jgi:hypothetical protein
MSTTDDPHTPGFEPPANDPPDPDFDVSEGEELALPPSAPPNLRARLALALKTTAPDVLAAAVDGFRGVFASCHDYLCEAIANELPSHLQWLPACTDPDKLRAGYENNAIAVWEIRLAADRVMVFESLRSGARPYEVPIGPGRVTVYAERSRNGH